MIVCVHDLLHIGGRNDPRPAADIRAMGIMGATEQLAAATTSMRAGRDALQRLADSPALAAEAMDAIAAGGRDAVVSLDTAGTDGARLLRDAWVGADELRRTLPGLAGALAGEQRSAATMAAAHADSAADLLDTFVYGGGAHLGGVGELPSTVGVQLDRGLARLEQIHVEVPRRRAAWER